MAASRGGEPVEHGAPFDRLRPFGPWLLATPVVG